MTPQTYIVDDCARRQDEQWMITFLNAPGFAVADRHIPVGTRVTVANGRVV